MDASLAALINLYDFSTGRRIFAHQQTQKAARALHFGSLVEHIDAALAHDRGVRALEARWVARSAGNASNPAAQAIDARVDRALTALRDVAVARTAGLEPGDPIHATVAHFLEEVFPAGVAAITAASYIDELAQVDRIVHKLTHGPLTTTVDELTLGPTVRTLKDLAVKYRAALEREAPESLDFGTVRAARVQGQGMLLETVALVLGKYHASDEASGKARAKLLSPVLQQNEDIRGYLRARRAVEDVNPDTGAVDPTAPTAGGGTGAGGAGAAG